MAKPVDFKYAPMFQMGEDDTEYRLLTKEGVSTSTFEGKEILKVTPEALTLLAQQAFHDVEFCLRRKHNEQVAAILSDPEASDNDRYVALTLLRNAETAVRASCLSARTPVRLLSTARRDNRYGLTSMRKRLSHAVCTTPTLRTTSVTLRMHR